MKRLKQIKRVFSGGESGFAFIAVLTFLILGAIIIGPLLGFMITGLRAQQSHEERTTELYSADAGVEYAIWHLQNGGLLLDDGTAAFTGTVSLDPFEINGDNVTVTVENENNQGIYFKIVSDATDMVTGSMTRVRARVTPTWGYQGNFFANGITALEDVDLKGECEGDIECLGTLRIWPGDIVRGDVTCQELDSQGVIYGDVRCEVLKNNGTIYGNVWYTTLVALGTVTGTATVAPPPDFTELEESWPLEEYLTSFYLDQVPSSNYPNSIVGVCGAIGPLYTGYTSAGAARNLTIDTKTGACEVRLDGTIFVTGDFNVTKDTLVNLNGQTIYCLGSIYFAPDSQVTGSGVIIGIGNVRFQPNIVASGGDSQPVIVHYDGSTWATQANAASSDLNDVWGASGANVFAVGDGGTILVTANGGASWAGMTSNTSSSLNGIWGTASDDIYAVGDSGTILHYNGTAWSSMTSGTASSLRDVWGSASDNVVYAVGDGGTILRYSGGAWSRMESLTLARLNGVWGSSGSDVYAVGAGGTIRRYNGVLWSSLDRPTLALRDVWGSSSTDVFFVGDGGTIVRYKENAWSTMTTGMDPAPDLMAVWGAAPNMVFAVGEGGAIIRYQGVGSVWTEVSSPTTNGLNGVWGSTSSNIYAVGDNAEDFVFIQSVSGWVELKPGGEFHGSTAGVGTATPAPGAELLPGPGLMAPQDVGELNFPRYRWMSIDTYIIEQH